MVAFSFALGHPKQKCQSMGEWKGFDQINPEGNLLFAPYCNPLVWQEKMVNFDQDFVHFCIISKQSKLKQSM